MPDEMDLVLVGLSHRTAPIEIRERVAIPEDGLDEATRVLRERCALPESLILSTCNRVEVMAHCRDVEGAARSISDFLHEMHRLRPSFLDEFIYRLQGAGAVRHIFRVAASLDSLVVGEAQILGQMKQAYRAAKGVGGLGRLERLVPRAFFVAKRVRRETEVGMQPVSIASVAVELAERIFGALKGKRAMLVGAGQMAELASQSLLRAGISKMLVANRTLQSAREMAGRLKGEAVGLENIDEHLAGVDVAVASTGASEHIITRSRLERVMRRRRNRPLFIIDIAVPRNVDPSASRLDSVFLYDIDDLHAVVEDNLAERKEHARAAEAIIDQEVEKFYRRLSSEQVAPMVRQLIDKFEEVCLRNFSNLADGLGDQEREKLEKHLRQSAHRLAHPIITEIKRIAADDPDSLEEIELIRRAFELEE